jgi:hypothetical protein
MEAAKNGVEITLTARSYVFRPCWYIKAYHQLKELLVKATTTKAKICNKRHCIN